MSRLINSINKKQTKKVNTHGVKAYSSTLNSVLDMFFSLESARTKSDGEVERIISRALSEDAEMAMKCIAYARDCRGGAGERKFFRIALRLLANNYYDFNLEQIPILGRWDDLFSLIGTPRENEMLRFYCHSLMESKNGLAAKWCPRKGDINIKLRRESGLSPKRFRKLIVRLTNVVETQMCQNRWSEISYPKVPSMANIKYNGAFLRHDELRRREYLGSVMKGEEKMNSSVAHPHEIVGMCADRRGIWFDYGFKSSPTADAMWKSLPNYMKGNKERLIVMADTSGSMCINNMLPLKVSTALACYVSERSEGIFKDHYISFSTKPELIKLSGKTISERLVSMPRFNPRSTNFDLAFNLILDTAVKNKLKNKDLPTKIIIVSDMELGTANNSTDKSMTMVKRKYKNAGYKMPQLVFWNVNSSTNTIPVRYDQNGVALVSGFSPSILTSLVGGKLNPMDVMMDTINKPKYEKFAI